MKKHYQSHIIRFIAVFLLICLLTLKRDGYFPFPKSLDSNIQIGLQVLQSAIVFVLIAIFVFAHKVPVPPLLLRLYKRYMYQGVLCLVMVLSVSIVALLYKDALVFADYYIWNPPLIMSLLIFSLTVMLVPLLLRRARLSLGGLLIGAGILFFIPILHFPITAKLSDLMPIIDRQLEAFLHGENIYQYYLLDNGVWTQAVRQPGTTLSYLPAYLLGLDLRVMSVLLTLLTALVLLRFAYSRGEKLIFDQKFLLVYGLLALFLLFPYRHIRADLYEACYWFLLSLSLILLARKKLFAFSCVWGLGIFTHVWNWLFSPFIWVYLWRRYGVKKASLYTGIYGAIGIGLLSIFIVPDARAYKEHVFGFYQHLRANGIYEVNSIHLTPLVHLCGGARFLEVMQVFVVALIGLISLKYMRTLKHLLMFLTLAFFWFVQFNSLVWNYMYMTMLVVLLVGTMRGIAHSKTF